MKQLVKLSWAGNNYRRVIGESWHRQGSENESILGRKATWCDQQGEKYL